MKDDQKTEILFESILEEIKKLHQIKGSAQPQDQALEKMQILFDDFIGKMRGLKINVPKQDLGPVEIKLQELAGQVKRIGTPIGTVIDRKEHYFMFFPDLKMWLHMIKRARVIWLLAVLLGLSLFGNYYLYNERPMLQEGNYKYKYMKYNGNAGLQDIVSEIDSAWQNPATRNKIISKIKVIEKATAEAREKEARIQNLKKELDSLQTK